MARGPTALDSSVVVAALCSWHERHDAARRALAALLRRREPPLLPHHALAESFSVLTRLPPGYRISPQDARDLLRDALHGRVRIVAADPGGAWNLLDDAVAAGAAGGGMYDFLILRAAVDGGARRLMTLNAGDFDRLGAADLEIVAP